MTMETVAVAVSVTTIPEMHKKNRIQVSNTKKPLFFYVNLAKRYIQQHNEVELSALGMGTYLEYSFIIVLPFTAHVIMK
ncbi:unnamed protein product [Ilex paraguariensis]|uniref:Uncharacterized protein n=1 Tax=Ilex paraguariensis TaxID=185542 RepID=A0ABC8T1U8_9AQUA